MKQITKIIQISIILILVTKFSIVRAQDIEVEQNFLHNKKWKMYEITDKVFEDKYENKTILHYYNARCLGESFYYLSNTADTIFDMSKLGKCKKGKYLISKVKDAKNDNFGVLEVLKAEGNELILRNIKQANSEKYFLKYRVSD